ncbi:hypothetical protein BGV52_10135 [Burkholderia ubonensis]|uniref:Uncharacterized protein n=1 Tax=Burkholderia ubonensis TaxID=101571 RepID=A0A119H846_9BURK|nr:hypothetical protein WL29_06450 [Burkholderia ubonensis]OJB10568.1 hypothetical protein BGV52_10135 [Burkholderia ubonensis]OJB24688.1 hypothetical protein BGV54_08505 [Burkholderia ubonensis]OJB55685.1 hypothetical protein BGV61_22450 [Burkholderia ubonensis]
MPRHVLSKMSCEKYLRFPSMRYLPESDLNEVAKIRAVLALSSHDIYAIWLCARLLEDVPVYFILSLA